MGPLDPRGEQGAAVQHSLGIYSLVARLRRPHSYRGKILLVSFLGTHVPLIALTVWAAQDRGLAAEWRVLVLALVATLVGTGATLAVLHGLLAPIAATSQALKKYLGQRELPDLPRGFHDEAGELMANAQETLVSLDRSLDQLRHFDAVTSLPNKITFRAAIERRLADTAGKTPSTLVILSLDNFTNVNALTGPGAADDLLRVTTERLRLVVPPSDLLARLDGADFGVLHSGEATSAAHLSERLRIAVAEPVLLTGNAIHPTAAIGVAVAPADGRTAEEFLRSAGVALEQSKRTGSLEFFAPELNTALRRRASLESDLRRAVDRDEWLLHYQPKIHLQSGDANGVEALVRWQSPTRGLVSPGEFIPVAEETGLILPLGERILRSACRQAQAWHQAGLRSLRTSVNLSAAQFRQRDLTRRIARVLEESKLAPSQLELEVTESMVMESVEQSARVLAELHEMGVIISLDDFGTGYSSLHYLRRLPLDVLKIDRSFVNDVERDADAAAIARSIIGLGQSLDLTVIAEGVETAPQLEFLRTHGCDEVQGYLFSKPLPADDCVQWLQRRRAA